MRRFLVFIAPLSVLALATFACENDASVTGPTFGLDASDLDVNLVVPPTDASAQDAATDADAAVPPNVTVTILGSATARTGVRVVFHDATGAVVESVMTGADGTATSTGATTPAMATVLFASGNYRAPITWTGLTAGENIQARALESTSDPRGNYQVTLPYYDGTGYAAEATSNCSNGNEATNVSIDLFGQCVTGATTTILGMAENDGPPAKYSFLTGIAIPGKDAGASVTLPAWTDPVTATLTPKNLPADTFVSTQLLEIANGGAYNIQYGYTSGQANTYPIPPAAFSKTLQGMLIHERSSSSRALIVRQTGDAVAMDLDFAQLLDPVTNGTFTQAGARPTVTWQGNTAGTSGGVVQFRYLGTDDANYQWSIVVPPGATSATVPALPADATSFAPLADGTLDSYHYPEIVFVGTDKVSPVLLRKTIGTFGSPDESDIESVILRAPMPVDGVYRITAYRPET